MIKLIVILISNIIIAIQYFRAVFWSLSTGGGVYQTIALLHASQKRIEKRERSNLMTDGRVYS
jgi:hypothetical protein